MTCTSAIIKKQAKNKALPILITINNNPQACYDVKLKSCAVNEQYKA